ncbi:hypothetical protein S7711_10965 [Stachybotrys chartarum IBT 7711]|uniref:Uncharacterized protein n=1 Tax=Stachybotrys chartarum (strain CBS 109288 / IBT 7711) TaxID=1280523 RepID=A0A084AK90_STACB|nr:hypothetical protein S7711_10965 [Stachybotrys chartarum IBT 7711]KFA54037.1 hypothetical protein S40293_10560 [Stachybotrys chartarum IBT 40293]
MGRVGPYKIACEPSLAQVFSGWDPRPDTPTVWPHSLSSFLPHAGRTECSGFAQDQCPFKDAPATDTKLAGPPLAKLCQFHTRFRIDLPRRPFRAGSAANAQWGPGGSDLDAIENQDGTPNDDKAQPTVCCSRLAAPSRPLGGTLRAVLTSLLQVPGRLLHPWKAFVGDGLGTSHSPAVAQISPPPSCSRYEPRVPMIEPLGAVAAHAQERALSEHQHLHPHLPVRRSPALCLFLNLAWRLHPDTRRLFLSALTASELLASGNYKLNGAWALSWKPAIPAPGYGPTDLLDARPTWPGESRLVCLS